MGRRIKPQPKRLAENLKQIRQSLDVGQKQIAEMLDSAESPVRPADISDFEFGKRQPSLLTLLAYSKLAGVQMEAWVDDNVELPKRLSQLRRQPVS